VRRAIVGLLDYGAGNTASVKMAVSRLGFRSRLVNRAEDFTDIALLLIPGVGAFPYAMNALNELDLLIPVREYAHKGNPIVGVCLGMQLLADASYEQGYTRGLELIPGEVKPIVNPNWHIGWNTLEMVRHDKIFADSDSGSFYFNHAYEFKAPEEYVVAVSRVNRPLVSIVRKHNICGFQFHPEKSQNEGLRLLGCAIKGLVSA